MNGQQDHYSVPGVEDGAFTAYRADAGLDIAEGYHCSLGASGSPGGVDYHGGVIAGSFKGLEIMAGIRLRHYIALFKYQNAGLTGGGCQGLLQLRQPPAGRKHHIRPAVIQYVGHLVVKGHAVDRDNRTAAVPPPEESVHPLRPVVGVDGDFPAPRSCPVYKAGVFANPPVKPLIAYFAILRDDRGRIPVLQVFHAIPLRLQPGEIFLSMLGTP